MISESDHRLGEFDLVLVDSGAATNCCPPWYGSQFPTRPGERCTLRAANGEKVPQHGFRRVQYYCADESQLTVDYTVADVKKPIISVDKLVDSNHTVVFNKTKSYITRETNSLEMVRENQRLGEICEAAGGTQASSENPKPP